MDRNGLYNPFVVKIWLILDYIIQYVSNILIEMDYIIHSRIVTTNGLYNPPGVQKRVQKRVCLHFWPVFWPFFQSSTDYIIRQGSKKLVLEMSFSNNTRRTQTNRCTKLRI